MGINVLIAIILQTGCVYNYDYDLYIHELKTIILSLKKVGNAESSIEVLTELAKTYMQIGNEWHLGLCAQKATVTNIASEQYYYNSEKRQGKTKTQSRIVNTVHKSPHFDSPWATAYQGYYNPLTEWMTWKCGSITFTF